jgi:hypothetical protein
MNAMPRQFGRRSYSRRRSTHLAFAVIWLVASGINAVAQSVTSNPPQLYLTSDDVPRKGYLEQQDSKRDDGRVSFRVCGTSVRIYVEPKKLIKTGGTCTERGPIFIVKAVNPDGSVLLEAQDQQTKNLTAVEWDKGFEPQRAGGSHAPVPKVGVFVGGIDNKRPGAFYLMDSAVEKGPEDIKG